MATFLDFIDYCINKKMVGEERKKHLRFPGVIDTAIDCVKTFVSAVRPDLYDADERYTALNHSYAAGAYTANWINHGVDLKTISQSLASDDALMLIMINSDIDRDSVDAMSTYMEDLATEWINMATDKAEVPVRLSNMLVGAFLLGVMTYMK